MRKALAAVFLGTTLLLLGILTGCSSNDKGSAAASGNASDEKVTLNVWGMGEEAKSLPKIADEFTKENPNITVKVQAIPWNQAHDKLLTAVASKKGPDVIQMGTTWIPEFADAKALMDLTPYVDTYPELKTENFYPGAVAAGTFEKTYVAAPWYVETRFLYYRSDLLKKVGYQQAPTTWEELSDAAQKLAARGKGKYGISIDTKEQSLGFMFARQAGAEWFDNTGKPLFNQPKYVEAVQYLNSFFQTGSAPKDSGLDAIVAFKGEGIVPMFISGPWMIKLIQDQAPELDGKWGIAVLPKKENNISILGGSNLSVFEYSETKDAAAKFVAYMSKPETQLKWMEATSSLPANTKAWDNELLTTDNYKIIKEQLDTAQPMPVMTQWAEISKNYLKHFERIYRSNADVQQEMDQFNQSAEKSLGK
ncbi:sugar ABC transporter substrate-binding protein [Paenibacillus xerothermodurans]|uniref:ABC transporter substrate-binding protein n=1 Tax=Paenibacillus xerothermodurans TaxID=1977292 RepID=A0A2W1P3F8_PAEXE|nr:sugar ABC transporter substrate-binding protein [Paenibacillus xerothermodurans]PZE22242.1 ABC transporter substrate-binding protein [Paenibacillus xerothermodurans]